MNSTYSKTEFNTSQINNTSSLTVELRLSVRFEGYLSLFIVLGHICALLLMRTCRMVQLSIKTLVQNLCIVDVIIGIWGSLRTSVQYLFISYGSEAFCHIEIFILTTVFNVSAILVTAIAVDRFCSIFYPMRYIIHVTETVIKATCFSAWICGIFLATLVLLRDLTFNEDMLTCSTQMEFQLLVPWLLISVRIISIVTICFTYLKMYIKAREISILYFEGSTTKELKSLAKVLIIVLPHLAVHLFYVITFFLRPYILIKRLIIFQSHLIVIAIFIDMWVYVLRFQECRLNFLISICCLCKSRQEMYRKRKQALYASYLPQ